MRVKWSQNFLRDGNVARRCVEALNLGPQDAVLEIGAGRGILTDILVGLAGKVAAVEIDPSLSAELAKRFSDRENFHLIPQDFLEVSLESHPVLKGGGFKVIGNLPYAVTSPILQKVLAWNGWRAAVFMVQKEVGERIMAAPGGKTYGVLSVSIQSRCAVEKVCGVSRHCFKPAPAVESMVLRLIPLEVPAFDPSGEKDFFRVVKAGFAQRRKTILNSLSHSLDLPSSTVRSALEKCGLKPQARAETLSLPDFKNLSQALKP